MAGVSRGSSETISTLVLAAFAAIAGAFGLRAYDLFWHLASGRWIVEHRALPTTDPFRFASEAAAWVDDKGKRSFERMAEGEFKVRNAELGKTYTRGGGLPAGSFAGQLFPAIPRSYMGDDSPYHGTGNYVVSVLVTEVDEYGEKVKETAERVSKEREGLIKRITGGD